MEMRVRLLPSTEHVDVSDLRVFVSYRFAETEKAEALAEELQAIGFQVTKLVPKPGNESISPPKLENELFSQLNCCDRLCVVASSKALKALDSGLRRSDEYIPNQGFHRCNHANNTACS